MDECESQTGKQAPATLPRPALGVLFDLDDTLYDRQAAFRNWGRLFLRERLGVIDEGECASTMAWIESLDANGYGSKHAVIVELCRRYPKAAGCVDTFYDEFVQRIELDPESELVLSHLEAGGIPFGIITNGSERQWRKIDALRLDARTNTILVSETFGVKKPHPSIFLAAAESIAVTPASILFVGDNPHADIAGAKSVGMLTAWLHRGRPWPVELASPDVTISRMSDLLPLSRFL